MQTTLLSRHRYLLLWFQPRGIYCKVLGRNVGLCWLAECRKRGNGKHKVFTCLRSLSTRIFDTRVVKHLRPMLKQHEKRGMLYMTELTRKLTESGQICMESFCCLATKAGRHARRCKKEERDVQILDRLQRNVFPSRTPHPLPRPLRHSQQRSKIRELMDATIQVPVHRKIIRSGDSACCRESSSKLFKMRN